MAGKEMSEVEPTTSSRTAATPDPSQIVSAYDWGALGDVIDVGGGDGTLLAALLVEYPALRGTVVDLPGTAETARKLFAAAGLADRGNAVGGDFFGVLPAGAEGYLLCSVLHRWDDEQARTILRNCATAAGEDGAVFVIEKVTDPATPSRHDTHGLAQLADAHDNVAGHGDAVGRERDVGELTVLAESAGLAAVAVHTAGTVAIIELAVS
jgi:hypothetical protein